MKWPWPFNLIERFSRFLTRFPNALLCAAGGIALAFTLIAAESLERKDIAVAVAIAGTFVGTALLSFFLPKLLYAMKEEELEQVARDASTKEKLVEAERRNRENERLLADAEREIAHLESMRINLDAFRSVLKLGLLEIEMNITDCQKQRIDTIERAKFDPRKDVNHEYVGVLKLPIRAQLGIDLAKVRLRVDDADRLVVSNITFSHVIETLEAAKWELDEVRSEYLKDGNVVEVHSDPADPRAKAQTRAHEAKVRQRLKEGQDFKCFEPGIIKAAEQTLKAFLGPIRKDVVFSEELDGGGEFVLSFLKKHNESLQFRIEDKRKAQNLLTT